MTTYRELLERLLDEALSMNADLRRVGRGRPEDGAHPDCPIGEARAYLAQPMTTCEAARIVEQYIHPAWLKDLDERAEEEREKRGMSLASSTEAGADAVSLRALLAEVQSAECAREGELVAALERIAKGRMDIGGKDEAMPRAVMMSEAAAALAQGKKE